MFPEMGKRDQYFYVHEMSRQSMKKIFRIKALKGPIKGGKVFWMHDHYELEEELSQVTATSLGTHDDVIDCLSDSWEVQVELNDDHGQKEPEINSVEWLIKEGMFPTVVEQEERARYGY